jgi:3-deoxy-D-arabino-heptulosonate 7-phosphate (DAHP) synthase
VRVTHCDDEHLIRLSSAEAAQLVDACALLLLTAHNTPGCALNSGMSQLLQTVFEHFSSHSV